MRTLWFKSQFVAAILAGEKSHTVRKASRRLPKVGEIVAFAVGPRPAFATVRIVSIESADDADAISAAASCYSGAVEPETMVRISFELIPASAQPDGGMKSGGLRIRKKALTDQRSALGRFANLSL